MQLRTIRRASPQTKSLSQLALKASAVRRCFYALAGLNSLCRQGVTKSLCPVIDSSRLRRTKTMAANAFQLAAPAMVRALCRPRPRAPTRLRCQLKVALMMDATAQTYGMATFAQGLGERPRLKWVRGLDQTRSPTPKMVSRLGRGPATRSRLRRANALSACASPSPRPSTRGRDLRALRASPDQRRRTS